MRMVLNEPLPVEVTDLLARRRALGLDLFDEVWNGEYHMNAAPNIRHGRVESDLHAILRPLAKHAGLVPTGQFNLGDEGDFRVPDMGFLRHDATATWLDDAAVVVEILSPHDESWQKFDHYAAHGVVEIFVVDPAARSVRMFERRADSSTFDEVAASGLLAVDASTLEADIDWP